MEKLCPYCTLMDRIEGNHLIRFCSGFDSVAVCDGAGLTLDRGEYNKDKAICDSPTCQAEEGMSHPQPQSFVAVKMGGVGALTRR